jgi:hypothetical protein
VDPSDYLTASEELAADSEPSVSPSPCPVPPPHDGMRPGRSRYDGQSLDWQPKDNHYPTPPPAPREDQTPLSSSEWKIRGPHRAAGRGAQIRPAPPPCEEVHTVHRASVY